MDKIVQEENRRDTMKPSGLGFMGSDSARTIGNDAQMSRVIREEAILREEKEKEERFGARVMLECTDVVKQ